MGLPLGEKTISENTVEYSLRLPASLRMVLRGRRTDVFDVFVRKFALCEDSQPGGGVPLDIMLPGDDDDGGQPPEGLARRLAELADDHGLTIIHGHGSEVAVTVCEDGDSSCAWTDSRGSRVGFRVSNPRRFVLQSVLEPIFRELFLVRGGLLMHSAAVSLPTEIGAMFVADGGGGKTTTALATVFAGAKLLSDDLVVVRCTEPNPVVEGIPEMMNLTRDTLSFFPALRGLYERFDELVIGCRNKTPVAPRDILDNDCTQAASPLDVIYQVRVGSDGPQAVRMPPTRALGLFVRAHTFGPAEQMKPQAFAGLSRLADKVKVYTLTTGSDPNALARWLVRHAQEHASG
ncbi:MAG: hypothetical protein A2Y76_11955 [Planctomycetes bacterium RBG_13_60_9]|nr:MAG: hypothetical protein A2Y76_11955 [Planctomycetes bacterium RBG_13_60_9]